MSPPRRFTSSWCWPSSAWRCISFDVKREWPDSTGGRRVRVGLCRRRPANGSIEQANRLGNERIEAWNGSGRRGQQGRSGALILSHRHPELAIEVRAADHGETIEIFFLPVE